MLEQHLTYFNHHLSLVLVYTITYIVIFQNYFTRFCSLLQERFYLKNSILPL